VAFLILEKVVTPTGRGMIAEGVPHHGDCRDGNTAMNMRTGEAFILDVCSFYGHKEYDTGKLASAEAQVERSSAYQEL